jgi:hypothetical protein
MHAISPVTEAAGRMSSGPGVEGAGTATHAIAETGRWSSLDVTGGIDRMSLEALTIEGRGRHMATPDRLGEQFGEMLSRFHSRSTTVENATMAMTDRSAAAPAPSRPESMDPQAQQAATDQRRTESQEALDRTIDLMVDFYEFAVETQLVAKGSTQLTSTLNTLLKGQ